MNHFKNVLLKHTSSYLIAELLILDRNVFFQFYVWSWNILTQKMTSDEIFREIFARTFSWGRFFPRYPDTLSFYPFTYRCFPFYYDKRTFPSVKIYIHMSVRGQKYNPDKLASPLLSLLRRSIYQLPISREARPNKETACQTPTALKNHRLGENLFWIISWAIISTFLQCSHPNFVNYTHVQN